MKRQPRQAPARRTPRKFSPGIEALETRVVPSGDAVLRWNQVALNAAVVDNGLGYPTEQVGPTRTSRALAIVHVAIYDAVNAIDQTYTSLLTNLVAPPDASVEAAIAQAGHDTLSALYTHQQATFDQDLDQDLAAIPDGPSKSEGIAVGQYVAAHTLAVRASDGAQMDAVGQPVNYVPGNQPGQWRPDPLHPGQVNLTPDWGMVTPFVLPSGAAFNAPPPPALDSPEYTAAYNEVKALGGDGVTTPTIRTPEQTIEGLFWGYDAQPGLCGPPRLLNQITEIIAVQMGNSEVENARLFALANVAIADAAIACWYTKDYYNFWRPVQAIRESDPGTGPTGLGDGNPNTVGDPTWTPLGAPADNGDGFNFTPAFPSYDSGHATIGAALFTVLRDFYGTDNITFTATSDEFNGATVDQNGQVRPPITLTFHSFTEAAWACAESRIYLGVHFSFDRDAGLNQGGAVGSYVFSHAFSSPLTPDQRFVNEVYRDLLGRRAEPQALANWTGLMNQGLTHAQAAQLIQASPEYLVRRVQQLFQTELNRPADPGGLAAALQFLDSGGTLEQLQAILMGSPEYFLVRGGGTVAGFLSAVKKDTLGQPLQPAEAAVMAQVMELGVTPTQLAQTFLMSPLAMDVRATGMAEQFLNRPGSTFEQAFWTQLLMSGMSDQVLAAAFLGSPEFVAWL